MCQFWLKKCNHLPPGGPSEARQLPHTHIYLEFLPFSFPDALPSEARQLPLTHTRTHLYFGKNQHGQKLMISIHIPFMEIAFSGPGPGGPNPTGLCPLQEYRKTDNHQWTSMKITRKYEHAEERNETQNTKYRKPARTCKETMKTNIKSAKNRKKPCRSLKFKEMHRKSHLPHDKST